MHVASEMQRDEYFRSRKIPLFVGGATTSKTHTAIKIAPNYEGPVVQVPDASRTVTVIQALLSDSMREKYIKTLADDYEHIRELHAQKKPKKLLSLKEARTNKARLSFEGDGAPRKPVYLGQRFLRNIDLAVLSDYIDWSPFFRVWDLAGSYPDILGDAVQGETARRVFDDGKKMLDKLIRGKWLTANATIALMPANSVNDDDIEIYTDETRSKVAFTYYGLRQQMERPVIDGIARPNQCLADFIAPKSSGIRDYIGLFGVTAGVGIEKQLEKFEAVQNDYDSIMLKALADRLVEALAEYLHQLVRRDLWGYSPDEHLTNEQLMKEQYRGIRPAPGYPSCPEHTVKSDLFSILKCEEIGMSLTESYAMSPTASITGFYFAHPEAHYFTLGKIGKDQVTDMAKRRRVSEEQIEQWLAPVL